MKNGGKADVLVEHFNTTHHLLVQRMEVLLLFEYRVQGKSLL